jgi:hypothetical protein
VVAHARRTSMRIGAPVRHEDVKNDEVENRTTFTASTECAEDFLKLSPPAHNDANIVAVYSVDTTHAQLRARMQVYRTQRPQRNPLPGYGNLIIQVVSVICRRVSAG